MVRPGSLVAYWDGHDLALAVVLAHENRRVRVVVARGQETKIAPSRIALEVVPGDGAPLSTVDALEAAGERIRATDERVRRCAAEIDVGLVWEIVAEDATDSGAAAVTAGELARLALDDDSGESRLALVRALLDDGIHFTRRGEDWVPRPAQSVAELELQSERVRAREEETRATFAALRAAAEGESYTLRGGDVERRYLDALEQFALHEGLVPDQCRDLAVEALEASGLRWDRAHEAAFRLLRCLGRFGSDDENLQPRRFGLRTSFPPEVIEAARRAAEAGPRGADREDLTDLDVVSIDGAFTREIDDAVSLRTSSTGRSTLGIHIADPAAFVAPGDPVDEEALARGLTCYFPDLKLTMMPDEISCVAASLVEGRRRPALSFLVDLDSEGRILDYRIVRSWVRSRARLDYEGADRMLREPEDELGRTLVALVALAEAREARRIESGAVPIHTPEVDLHVAADGTIALERLEGDSASRLVVTESMILAGKIAARVIADAGIDAIHRRQAAPPGPVEVPPGGVRDRVQARGMLKGLKRANVSLRPGPHHSLGLEAYAQVTSPLRRFQDLANHRQLVAHLEGREPAYDEDALRRIAATTDRADAEARVAERSASDYWKLAYLRRFEGELVDAVVVEDEPRVVVQLEETLWEQPMRSLSRVEAGERVRVRVERVVPRAGLLVLRPGE